MDDIIPQDTPQKQCTKCKRILPATSDYFPRESRSKDGFRHFCKECLNAYHRKLRKEGPVLKEPLPDGFKRCSVCEKILPATPEYFHRNKYSSDGFTSSCKEHSKRIRKGSIVNGMKICPRCKRELPATSEYFHARKERKSGFRSKCKVCESEIESRRIRPKETKEHHRMRYLATRESYLQRRYAYYHEHIEEYRLYYQRYRQTHIEQCKANGHNRRARNKAAPGKHTAHDIKQQYLNQKGRCYYCAVKLGKGKRDYHVDHIVPLSRGGSNDPSNLVITCPSCNLNKKDKLPHEWPEGGRLL